MIGGIRCKLETRNDGEWHEVILSVRGDGDQAVKEILSGGAERDVESRPEGFRQISGGVAFVLAPHSEVHIRDFNVKVVNRTAR